MDDEDGEIELVDYIDDEQSQFVGRVWSSKDEDAGARTRTMMIDDHKVTNVDVNNRMLCDCLTGLRKMMITTE